MEFDQKTLSELLAFYAIPSFEFKEWIEVQPTVDLQLDDESVILDLPKVPITSLESARALLEEDKDPLNVKHATYLQQLATLTEAKKSSSMIRLTASHFNPSTFLKLIHYDTGYVELLGGKSHLEDALKSKDEVLKCLVKQNFDRFVRALNSIQAVHADMQSRGLTQDDLVTRRVADSLTDLSLKAQDVFRELVKETERKEQLKKRAAFFEKYHELFELPVKLSEYLQKSEFREAIRAMKIAQMQLEELPLSLRLKIEQGLWVQQVIPLLANIKEQLLNKLKSPIFSYSQHEHFATLLETLGVDVASVYADYLQRETLTALQTIITQELPKETIKPDTFVDYIKAGNMTKLNNASWKTRIGILKALNTRLRFCEEELRRFKEGFGKGIDCNKIEQEVFKYIESNLGFLKCTTSDTLAISAWQSLQAVDILKMDIIRASLQEHVQECLDGLEGISARDWIVLVEFTKKCWPGVDAKKAIESWSKSLLNYENLLSALADARVLGEAGYPVSMDTISSIQSKYIQSHVSLFTQTPKTQLIPLERRLHEILLQLTMIHASLHDFLPGDKQLVKQLITQMTSPVEWNATEAEFLKRIGLKGVSTKDTDHFDENIISETLKANELQVIALQPILQQ